jgi:hypothetical protein
LEIVKNYFAVFVMAGRPNKMERVAIIEAVKEVSIAASRHEKKRDSYLLKCSLTRSCPYGPFKKYYGRTRLCHSGDRMPISFATFDSNLPPCEAARGIPESEEKGFKLFKKEGDKSRFYRMSVNF